MKIQEQESIGACINTEDNELFLSIYSVLDGKLTGEEETLFLRTDNSGYYKIKSRGYGQVNMTYFSNDNGIVQHYKPEINFEKHELVLEDFKKIEENKALLGNVMNLKVEETKKYMFEKIAELEKSGIQVKKLGPQS